MKTTRGTARQRRPAPQRDRTGRRSEAAGTELRDPRRRGETQARKDTRRRVDGQPRGRARDPRGLQNGPVTTPTRRTARPKNAGQAKARAKARKAKAPKVVRLPLRERMVNRLATIELNPRTLAARVPFVVLVIGALGVGLGMTLWLSTDAAERAYQLGEVRQTNQALMQQKEALERDVLEAQAAPALAEAARNLGMIPSRDTAHLVQDPEGNWFVVGTPKPAEGAPPPPLNTPLPEVNPVPQERPAPRAAATEQPAERSVEVPRPAAGPAAPEAAVPGPEAAPHGDPAANPEVVTRRPAATPERPHLPAAPGPAVDPGAPALGPMPGPALGPQPGPSVVTEPGPAVAPEPAPAQIPEPAPVLQDAV